jgi:hypothetical protein
MYILLQVCTPWRNAPTQLRGKQAPKPPHSIEGEGQSYEGEHRGMRA